MSKCRRCGKDVVSGTDKCPHCGIKDPLRSTESPSDTSFVLDPPGDEAFEEDDYYQTQLESDPHVVSGRVLDVDEKPHRAYLGWGHLALFLFLVNMLVGFMTGLKHLSEAQAALSFLDRSISGIPIVFILLPGLVIAEQAQIRVISFVGQLIGMLAGCLIQLLTGFFGLLFNAFQGSFNRGDDESGYYKDLYITIEDSETKSQYVVSLRKAHHGASLAVGNIVTAHGRFVGTNFEAKSIEVDNGRNITYLKPAGKLVQTVYKILVGYFAFNTLYLLFLPT